MFRWCGHEDHVTFLDEINGRVYSFPSVRPGCRVLVAVPNDRYMRSAVSTALRAAIAGMRLPGQSRVSRVLRVFPDAEGGE